MEKNLFLEFKPHDETLDTLSTDAASLTHLPGEDNSPSNLASPNSLESETVSKNKRIRKKRNAYHKIDDEIRLHLLQSVQRGETLKSAAKRYNVNYSSAKSIFHIYRKEGRILKKATTEKGFGFDYPGQPEHDMQAQAHFAQNHSQGIFSTSYQRPILPQNHHPQQSHIPHTIDLKPAMFSNFEEQSGSSSPLNNLVDNFADLLRIGGNPQGSRDDILRNKSHMPLQPSRFNPMSSPTHSVFKMKPNQPTPQNQMGQHNHNHHHHHHQQFNQLNHFNQLNRMAQISLASRSPGNGSMSPMKQFDNFYMNYSNSPLSGNNRMIKEGSESGSNRYQKEFESFSEMISSFQAPSHLTDTIKKNDISIPKLHTNMTPTQHHNVDNKLAEEDLVGSIEYAALDTYKSFLDAQMVVSNAYKKASYLNNLVNIQKTSGSPSSRFISF